MWVLEEPIYLLLFIIYLPAIYLCHFYRDRGGVISLSIGISKKSSFQPKNIFLKTILFLLDLSFWAGIALLFLALAGPSFVEKEKIYLSRGVDIVFVLDESPSMAAKDFPNSNRFDVAKKVIKEFVAGREHDPVGLVTFADQAALRIPPTLDTKFFFNALDQIELMELGNGTAIGMGISIASLHLKQSTATEKIIILVTDGENNAGQIAPIDAAKIAGKMQIKIYTIGVGTSGEVPIEYVNKKTGRVISGEYKSNLDKELLTKISDLTGGKFFYAKTASSLNAVMSSIDSLEGVEKRIKIKTKSKAYYREFIQLGLLLIMIAFFIKKLFFREVL